LGPLFRSVDLFVRGLHIHALLSRAYLCVRGQIGFLVYR